MTARWALYRTHPPDPLNTQSCITYAPGPGSSCITCVPRPRHRRLQRSPHITKASATDLLDLWRVLGHAGVPHSRAPLAHACSHCCGMRARSLGAPSLWPPLLSLPSLPLLSLPCAPPVVTACRRSQCCAAVLRRQRLAACPLDAAVPACRTRHAEPHARARWPSAFWWATRSGMAGKPKSRVLFLPLADPVLMQMRPI